jgi:hypothetical protein
MASHEKKTYHVADIDGDIVYAVNIPTLEQAKAILDETYSEMGCTIIDDDELTPSMVDQINDAYEKGLI